MGAEQGEGGEGGGGERSAGRATRWLAVLERAGNRLPDPITLFALGAGLVMVVSQVAVWSGWSAEGPSGRVEPVSLLDADGLFWAFSSCVDNFKEFRPLVIVLVGMLGIGLAERSGFLPALLRRSLQDLPSVLLTPSVFGVGVLSSLTMDAGYVVLPPIATALYQNAGRSPLTGLAVVFAGVSAGFGANLVLTGLDPILAAFSQSGAALIDPDYTVNATANLYFMMGSTLLLVALGWWVTARFVEPVQNARPPEAGGPSTQRAERTPMAADETRALRAGLVALGAILALLVAAAQIPGAPLNGPPEETPRWIQAIVPILFVTLFFPGLVYGAVTGTIRSDRDVAKMLGDTMAAMGPYVVMAFFAAQFIAYFDHSRLGALLAIHGGRFLVEMQFSPYVVLSALVLITAVANLFVGSMSAKYAFFAPVFVPMLMQAGLSPELTQVAYRIGDSVSNTITPLNPYLPIILVLLQRYDPKAGIGTLVAMMLPYTIVFGVVWTAFLLLWVALGIPLGPAGPLWMEMP